MKLSSPSSIDSSPDAKIFLLNLLVITLVLVAVYFRLDVFTTSCFILVVASWEFLNHIWCSPGSFEMERPVFSQSTFVLSPTMVDSRRSVCLHGLLLVTFGRVPVVPDPNCRISCIFFNRETGAFYLLHFIHCIFVGMFSHS